MKKDIHPSNYRPTVFEDTNSGFKFLTRSTAPSEETIKWEDGNEYPLVKIHISSASHPFYTGEEKIVDIEGRVDRFKARRKAAQDRRASLVSKAKKTTGKGKTKNTKNSTDKTVSKVGSTAKPINKSSKSANKKPDKKTDDK